MPDMPRIIVIPARLDSVRLPEKLLRADSGKPLLQHTYERCRQVPTVSRVVVAAAGPRLVDAARDFGAEVVETDPDLPSGTDRVAVAVASLGLNDDAGVVNVQGDEPEIDPAHVDQLFRLLETDSSAPVATLTTLRHDPEGFLDPNRVKVAMGSDGYAHYFSRAPIPYPRDRFLASADGLTAPLPWRCHLGIYGFRPAALRAFRAASPAPLEAIERLEQLRFLDMGFRIKVGEVAEATPGIDTWEDYREFVGRVAGRGVSESEQGNSR